MAGEDCLGGRGGWIDGFNGWIYLCFDSISCCWRCLLERQEVVSSGGAVKYGFDLCSGVCVELCGGVIGS